MTSGILSFADARRVVLDCARALLRQVSAETEPVTLLHAAGRVLAQPVVADRDQPPFPRSARDGYAVRAQDVASLPARLRVIGEVRAGADASQLFVSAGQAGAIMTGAAVPRGADAVVMIEHTRALEDGSVELSKSVAAGENLVPAGAEARRGDVLLARGARLDHRHIAAAAAVGAAEVLVYRRPRVAILATGDEIVDVAAEPGAAEIRNSNSYSLAAQVAAAGGEAVLLPIAADDETELAHLIAQGLAADLLLISGGVSAGKYDLAEPVLARFGARFFFTGAAIQPGKPIVFGEAHRRAPAGDHPVAQPTPFFGLPGNPVSTMVTFELFVRPVLDALGGAPPASLSFVQARLKSAVRVRTGLTRFLPARLSGEGFAAEVERVEWQGSGDIAATARANCYLVIPPEVEEFKAGEMVWVLMR